MPWRLIVAIASGLVVSWLALLVVIGRAARGEAGRSEALRLLPDLLRLIRRLAADRTLPRGVRVRLALVLGYLALPFDLVPDFIPVIGYADDVVVVALGLRSVVRRAGPEALRRHWPGSDEGLAALGRLVGVALG